VRSMRSCWSSSRARPWPFELSMARLSSRRCPGFDLHPDGDPFVVSASEATVSTAILDRVVLVANFFDEVRRLTAARAHARDSCMEVRALVTLVVTFAGRGKHLEHDNRVSSRLATMTPSMYSSRLWLFCCAAR
jgi:hypothetical protein